LHARLQGYGVGYNVNACVSDVITVRHAVHTLL